ncbi:MAG: M28 family metallopeptidase [Phycisphaerales bacterium]
MRNALLALPISALACCSHGQIQPASHAQVEHVMTAVSPEHLRDMIDRLAAFGTRHTLSDTASDDRGIGAARRWLRDQLQKIADSSGRDDITVQLMRHTQPPSRRVPDGTEIVNVVMIIPGVMSEAKDRMYVVLGHYDSRNGEGMDAEGDAPGADDDGSGTAAVLELARIFSGRPCDATTVFLMTAGEEQGLYGAQWFAKTAVDEGWNIQAALSNDIIGDPSGPNGREDRERVRVFSQSIPRNADDRALGGIRRLGAENDSPSRQLARYIHEIARRYDTAVKPWLINRTDRFLRGGDHTSFNNAGFTAVRFSEVYETYDRQHQNIRDVDGRPYGDVPRFVDEVYLADVARLNGAALYSLANAPSTPQNVRLITSRLANDTTIRWDSSPEPDVAGYEVVYRETTSHLWRPGIDVGNTNEYTIDLSKDNWFFGVRAYDSDGHRSPVQFAGAGRE